MNRHSRKTACFVVVLMFITPLPDIFAAYDPSGVVKKGKRWAVSVGLRGGYNDNTTASGTTPKGSLFNGADILGRYSYPTDTTFLSVSTTTSGSLFLDRADNNFDFGNNFNFNLAHTFSPRLDLDVTDRLRFGQEPQIAENNAVVRRSGDYINNLVNIGLSYRLTRKWSVDLTLLHDLWMYDDPVFSTLLGRQSMGGGPSCRYHLTEKMSLSGNYRLVQTEYERKDRRALSQTLSAGTNYRVTRKWNANLEGGAEFREEEHPTAKTSLMAPFFSLGSSYAISEKAVLLGTGRYSFQETDISSFYVSRTLLLGLKFDWTFGRNLSSVTSIDMAHNDLEDSVGITSTTSTETSQTSTASQASEVTYVFYEKVSWDFRENITFYLSYSRTQFDSDFALRSYEQNIMTVGGSYVF